MQFYYDVVNFWNKSHLLIFERGSIDHGTLPQESLNRGDHAGRLGIKLGILVVRLNLFQEIMGPLGTWGFPMFPYYHQRFEVNYGISRRLGLQLLSLHLYIRSDNVEFNVSAECCCGKFQIFWDLRIHWQSERYQLN